MAAGVRRSCSQSLPDDRRRKTHSGVVYACLGLAAAAQSLVVLCAPFVKALSFVDGKLYARRDGNFASPSNARFDGDPLVILRVGWLGSCIQDMTTRVSTCTLPSFPGSVCVSAATRSS